MNSCMKKQKKYRVIKQNRRLPAIVVDASAKQEISVVKLQKIGQDDYVKMIKEIDDLNRNVKKTYYSTDTIMETLQRQSFSEWIKNMMKKSRNRIRTIKQMN